MNSRSELEKPKIKFLELLDLEVTVDNTGLTVKKIAKDGFQRK